MSAGPGILGLVATAVTLLVPIVVYLSVLVLLAVLLRSRRPDRWFIGLIPAALGLLMHVVGLVVSAVITYGWTTVDVDTMMAANAAVGIGQSLASAALVLVWAATMIALAGGPGDGADAEP